MAPIKLAYYVTGHGFGHATRSSALIQALLDDSAFVASVHIVSDVSEHAFRDILDSPKVFLRNVKIDVGMAQPKAYDVDRKATVELLTGFLKVKTGLVANEAAWLKEQGIQLVIGDAPFVGMASADAAGIPSVLVTNFTFDSCYSYLSVSPSGDLSNGSDDTSIPDSVLEPLVTETIAEYKKARLLIRLPGAIPIPAFDTDVSLPSATWINAERSGFTPEVEAIVSRKYPPGANARVIDSPLIARWPNVQVYKPEYRTQLLSSAGVPEAQHGCHVLLVSFGGQVIPSPQQDGILLPPGWIALVCGADALKEAMVLPECFYPAPSALHVPDITAISDVLLGKLGYGTCSEALSVGTPFVYVPRPLFVEEYGLRRMMHERGTAAALSRDKFEAGDWADTIIAAHKRGEAQKNHIRSEQARYWAGDAESTDAPAFVSRTRAAKTVVNYIEEFYARG